MAAKKRDYAAEYRRRVERGRAAGKGARESTGRRSQPSGFRDFDPGDDESDVTRYLRRLRGDRVVYLHALVSVNGEPAEDVELYPNGGIRVATLLGEIAAAGGLVELVERLMGAGTYHTAPNVLRDDPAGLRNVRGGSPRVKLDMGRPVLIEVESVWLQWQGKA